MKLDSPYKLYIYELKNLYSGEQQYADALQTLARQAEQTPLSQALLAQAPALERQLARLDTLFEAFAFSPGGQKCQGLAGLIKAAQKSITEAQDAVTRDWAILAGWRRINGYLASDYLLARDSALRLGRPEDAALLNVSLGEKLAAAKSVCDAVLPAGLRADGGPDRLTRMRLTRLLARGQDYLARLTLSAVARVALAAVSVALILATLLSLLPLPDWWVRVFDFPRVQIAALAGLALIGYALLLRRRRWPKPDIVLASLLLSCIGYQLYRIYPYTPLASYQAEPYQKPNGDKSQPQAVQFRLMVANVLMENRNAAALLDNVDAARPDLLLVVETDQWWIERLAPLRERYPYAVTYPLDNTYGMALYSRLELVSPQVNFLIEDDIPSIHTTFLLPEGTPVELHALHPRPPGPTKSASTTARDAELLLVGEQVKDSPHPVIVAGDLNDVAWSATTRRFQRISGLLDPRIGRGLLATFHAGYPLLRWPLDHVFFSDHLRVVEMDRLAYFGSDHFPIVITLSYQPQTATPDNDPEPADREDRQEAQQTIDKAKRNN